MDIRLNENFDFQLDGTNDMPLVTGRDLFEQRVAVAITAFFDENIGRVDDPNLETLLELQVHQVAKRFGEIENVAAVRVEPDPEIPNAAHLYVTYNTGEEFAKLITE